MAKRLDERKKDFFNALERLKVALKREQELSSEIYDDIIVDGIIQRFEFTFEQSFKCMKLYLEDQGILDEALAPRSTIRCAFSNRVIQDGAIWIEMMVDRNRTSHMYDEKTALEILELIKEKYIGEFIRLKEFFEKN